MLSISGEFYKAMSGRPDWERPRAKKQLGEDEVLLEQYKELRESIRETKKELRTRETRGIASIAVILAYSFYADGGQILITLVPVIIGILFINTIATTIWLLRLAEHTTVIQNEINVDDFSWEVKYGMYSPRKAIYIPTFSFYLIMSLIYILSLRVSIRIVNRPDTFLFGFEPSPDLFCWFYALVTILMLATTAAFLYDISIDKPN